VSSSLLTLLDDIASLLQSVAAMTKIAAKKSAGMLGDDLALNAEQVTGVQTARELPVVYAVFKGSAINKLVIVPAALAISFVSTTAVTVLLMLGGAFLCFEGFEKVVHKLLHREEEEAHREGHLAALVDPTADLVAFERERIKGAIRTDMILSAEIIVITLDTVADEALLQQALVLSAIAVLMTVGVYGLVAAIVKLDDFGLALARRENSAARGLGGAILAGAPYLMKGLSIAGTVAMFLVGGGILAHEIPAVQHFVEEQNALVGALVNGAVGLLAGALLVGVVTLFARLRKNKRAAMDPNTPS
jgi:predicted DNA repair protein MutK